MPQHPRYSNSHQKNLDDLYDVLLGLEKFGFIHEELHQPIDILMSELHADAYSRYEQAYNPGLDRDDEDFEPPFIPSASELFEYVEESDRALFVQDFRNVIAHLMYSDSWSTEGVTQKISKGRDLDYMKMHTKVDCDPETQQRFRGKDRSMWFSSDIPPVRAGVYEVTAYGHEVPKLAGYAFWDGKSWYERCVLFNDCVNQPKTKANRRDVGYCWRGLFKSPD